MIVLLSFFISVFSYAFPQELAAVYQTLKVHEFYQDNELITKPLDAWQTIVSFSVSNSDLSLSQVCLKYRPAVEAQGVFRVEKMDLMKNCDESGKIIYELNSLHGIQFERGSDFKIVFTHKDFSMSSWVIKTLEIKRNLELLDSPDKAWGETVLFLTEDSAPSALLADGVQCLKVLDDCTIIGVSTCHQCQNGSLEAPNGCLIAPRYCSSFECGTKGNPACRRGVKVFKQRVLDCRKDSGFAFCSGEATPTCQGSEVWCH